MCLVVPHKFPDTHTLNGSAQLQDQWPTGGPTTDIAACQITIRGYHHQHAVGVLTLQMASSAHRYETAIVAVLKWQQNTPQT